MAMDTQMKEQRSKGCYSGMSKSIERMKNNKLVNIFTDVSLEITRNVEKEES